MTTSRRYLFLDDDENRHRAFHQRTVGHLVQHVRSAHECLTALLQAAQPYDVVLLDHDLDDEASGGLPPITATGMVVAAYIRAQLPEHRRPKEIIVHSMAGGYAPLMVALIEPTGIPVRWVAFGRALLDEFEAKEAA